MLRVIEKRYDANLVQSRHAHSSASVTLLLGGSLRERVGRVEETAHALSLVVKPVGVEHANVFGAHGTHALQLMVSEPAARAMRESNRALASWGWRHGGPAVPAFMRLLRALRLKLDDDAVERATFDALAAIPDGADLDARGNAPHWLLAVRERLDDEPAPPRVHEMARAAGVHPVYLARQFRRWFACSVTEYAQRRRLQRAATSLSRPGVALATAAHESGFFDQAHMCHAFQRGVGVPPSDYRRLVSTVQA